MKVDDIVEVRSEQEILATLDLEGRLEGLPFMPEMLKFCGRKFRVSAVAHKTCDTSHKTGGRRMANAVHLEDLRCDGSSHGGCQATCLLFWKTEWLKIAGARKAAATHPPTMGMLTADELLAQSIDRGQGPNDSEPRYVCQATRLHFATSPLKWWDVRQYVRDVTCRNATPGRAARVIVVSMFRALTRIGTAYRLMSWIYDRAHRVLNGFPAPDGGGRIPQGAPTPDVRLDLVPGESVRVRSHDEIKATLNEGSRNRGMWFDHEMVKFCGKPYRVQSRVERIIDETSGKMLTMRHPCIVLQGVWCTAEYTEGRLLCRRAVTTYWREAWLEREKSATADDLERAG